MLDTPLVYGSAATTRFPLHFQKQKREPKMREASNVPIRENPFYEQTNPNSTLPITHHHQQPILLSSGMMISSLITAAATVMSISSFIRGATAFSRTPVRIASFKHKSLLSTSQSQENVNNEIRYLGSGPDAIVRPGVVLVAPEHEYDHFLMKSAVFVYAIGLDDNNDLVIRGVIIDHPTAFTVGEMSSDVVGALANNPLFRGGRDGQDSAMLLHSAGGPSGHIQSGEMIGNSGVYEGGISSAIELVDKGLVDSSQCKFFFNYMTFRELELDDLFASTEDGDSWASLEVPPEYVLNSDLERGEMWMKLRGTVKKNRKAS